MGHPDTHKPDWLIDRLHRVIRFAVKLLAILMIVVIYATIIDVGIRLFKDLSSPPYFLVIEDILGLFGAFMAALIAIEIFVNITVYLRDDVIHVKIVMATALMAVARKIIILDYNENTPLGIMALACVTLAMSIGYWLVVFAPGNHRAPLQHIHKEGSHDRQHAHL